MKTTLRFPLLSSALWLGLAAVQPLGAYAAEATPAVSSELKASSELRASSEPSPYAAGTRAMNDHRWQDAVASFDQVVNAKAKNADAALYWKAYSLNKLGNKPLALATCYQLRSQYTVSTWNKDCSALSIDYPVPPVPPVPSAPLPPLPPFPPFPTPGRVDAPLARGSDADLKMLALNSLLNQDPARAIPLLRGILAGNQPIGVKKHALFVLAQSGSPEAQSILRDAATGKLDPSLQRQAIQTMGIFQGKRSADTLTEVYRSTSDAQIKKSVIEALFIAQDAPRMVELAKSEKDLNLKRAIVSQLAVMNDKAATDYMLELLK